VYYRALDESGETILFRTVAREEAFYAETYRGDGRWEVDSEPSAFLLGGGDLPPPEPSFAIDGRAAAANARIGREPQQKLTTLGKAAGATFTKSTMRAGFVLARVIYDPRLKVESYGGRYVHSLELTDAAQGE
jgi:hypothetical protein